MGPRIGALANRARESAGDEEAARCDDADLARRKNQRTTTGRARAVGDANQIGQGLRTAIGQLSGLGKAYALVGGFAVNVRTEPRFTADVDFAVSVKDDAEAEAVAFALQQAGWVVRMLIEHHATHRLGTARFQVPDLAPDLRIDLLFASTGVEPEVVAGATRERVASGDLVPTATVGHLIALKCLSESPRRLKDRGDLLNLLAVASQEDLRVARGTLRLITQRGYARKKNLLKVLERFRRLARTAES